MSGSENEDQDPLNQGVLHSSDEEQSLPSEDINPADISLPDDDSPIRVLTQETNLVLVYYIIFQYYTKSNSIEF